MNDIRHSAGFDISDSFLWFYLAIGKSSRRKLFIGGGNVSGKYYASKIRKLILVKFLENGSAYWGLY